MKELPKIARERLAARPRPAGDSAGADASVFHLDANLVSAFVERALLPAERTRVLEHLVGCGQCRAEVQFVMRAAQADAVVPRVASAEPVKQAWWSWMLRWEAASAGAVAVLALAAVWVATSPVSRLTTQAPATVAANSPPLQNPGIQTGTAGARLKSAPSPGIKRLRTGVKTAPEQTLTAQKESPVRAPLNGLIGGAPVAVANGESGAQAAAPRSAGEAALQSAPQAPTAAASSASPKPSAAASGVLAKATDSATATQADTVVVHAEASPAAEARPAKAFATQGLMAARKTALRSAERGVLWAIPEPNSGAGSLGTVRQSRDGGRTWQSVTVAPGVHFRVVFALADDLWAGGAEGALYHSADGGRTWSSVQISAGQLAISGDIVSIKFADAAHGLVTTSTGERWATSEGGQHWELTH